MTIDDPFWDFDLLPLTPEARDDLAKFEAAASKFDAAWERAVLRRELEEGTL